MKGISTHTHTHTKQGATLKQMSKSHMHMHTHCGIFMHKTMTQHKKNPIHFPTRAFQQSQIYSFFFLLPEIYSVLTPWNKFLKKGSSFIIHNLRSTPCTANVTIYNNKRQQRSKRHVFRVRQHLGSLNGTRVSQWNKRRQSTHITAAVTTRPRQPSTAAHPRSHATRPPTCWHSLI